MRRIHPEMLKRARRLRKDQTPAEATLWARLRDGRLDNLKFRRQHPIGPFIADFYFPQARLVIELDGGVHRGQMEYDQDRTAWLNSQGYRVIRFSNHEVRYQLEAVLEAIRLACREDCDG
ncbi:MAG: endonuclease domain-containing protein [Anaerolineales bacterium]|nr:endonuclease domain-containing protein [Anaerolineales bacterium]